ncbi:MAG: hypothetical protein OK439_06200 [Thaumarchaeota archaeon]|nr:hypothetical protein [Nitrososphaerota archaeon]
MSIVFLTFAMLSPSVAATTQGSQFVAYQIIATTPARSISAVVNESVSPSSTSGFSSLTLQLASNMGNFSYSKIVNTTKVMLPYFPSVANQSLSFQYHNFSISLAIAQLWTDSVSYKSQTYTLTNYAFNVSGSKTGGTPIAASGHVSTFPSGLVYSATVTVNGTDTIQVMLLGTNLDLNSSSNSSQTTTAAIAGGAGSILAGVGAFVFYKRKNGTARQDKAEDKPLYHVD